ncbi:MAG: hypothetical protein AAB508_02380, partial [Patescibacteria group bacterium]
ISTNIRNAKFFPVINGKKKVPGTINGINRVKEKLETLLELSNNHQSLTSGSVGNPKSSLNISDIKNKDKTIENPRMGAFSEAEATNTGSIGKPKK